MLVDICVQEDEYIPFILNDCIQFKHEFTMNHLDHGLCNGIDSMYGIIIGSDNYGDDFNPYYYKLNLLMFDLDKDNKIIMTPKDVYNNEIMHIMPTKCEELMQIYQSIEES